MIFYYLILLYPLIGISLAYIFSLARISIPKTLFAFLTGIIFFSLYGLSTIDKQVEFAILYISFLGVFIFIWKQFPRINFKIYVVVITAYMSLFGFGGMFWVWVIGGHIGPVTHKALKEDYILVMKGTGNFSHSAINCTLSKEIIGEYLVLNINSTSLSSVEPEDIIIVEKPDKSIQLKSKFSSDILKKSRFWIVLFYIFLFAWITSLIMIFFIERESAKIKQEDYNWIE